MRPIFVLIICCLYYATSIAQKKDDMSLSPREVKDIYAYYEANKNKDLDYTQKIPPHQLQADLKTLKLILEEAHTNMYNYSTKEEVNKVFNEALIQARDSLPYLGLVKLVARIQNVIACGHSNWDHPASYRRYRNENVGLFPLDIEISNGTYSVKHHYGDWRPFDFIYYINDSTTDAISKQLLMYLPRDGNSDPLKELELSENFRYAYSNFIGDPPAFELFIPGGQNKSLAKMTPTIVTPMLRPVIDSIADVRRYKPDMGQPLSFFITPDNLSLAVYQIKWFNNEYIASQGQNFIAFTDSVFKQLTDKNIKNLVIDLRGNVGGWTANGRHLFSYFIDKQVPYIKSVRTQKYKDYSFAPLITKMPGYNDTMKLVQKDGLYEWQNNPNLVVHPAPKNRFKGKVFILTDGNTRSAASIFCALMKEHTKAIFIGEETGASRSIQGGMVMTVQLPYSHLLVNFSTARYDLAVSDRSTTGIIPDHKIARGLNSVVDHMDMVQSIIIKQ